jgi:hypothetical protein
MKLLSVLFRGSALAAILSATLLAAGSHSAAAVETKAVKSST